MKDGESNEMFASSLECVDVGFDEDGEAITSCVVIPSEAVPAERRGTRTLTQSTNNARCADKGRAANKHR